MFAAARRERSFVFAASIDALDCDSRRLLSSFSRRLPRLADHDFFRRCRVYATYAICTQRRRTRPRNAPSPRPARDLQATPARALFRGEERNNRGELAKGGFADACQRMPMRMLAADLGRGGGVSPEYR